MTSRPLIAGIILMSIGVAGACARQDAPPAPVAAAPDGCVVALAPAQGQDRLAEQIEQTRQDAARRGPNTKAALERLGYLHVARARVTGDAGHYTLAEAVANCLQASYPGESAALLLRGHVLHQLHRFNEAEQIARALVAKRTVVLDFGLLGDALMEQGRLDEAATAYQRMIDLKPFYQSYTRAAHVRWMKGDLEGALRAMRLATESASPRDPESSAWAWTRVALYELQANRLPAARQAADAALSYEPAYAAALLAKGRILLAEKHRSEALTALTRAASLNPLPEYQWILADTLRSSGLRQTPRRSNASWSRAARPATHARSRSTSRLVARTARPRYRSPMGSSTCAPTCSLATRARGHWRPTGGPSTPWRPSCPHSPKARRTPGCSCTPASFMPPRATA